MNTRRTVPVPAAPEPTAPRTTQRDWAALVRQLQSSLVEHVGQRLVDLELPFLQWAVLLRLGRRGPCTLAELARELRADGATLMRAVDRLEERAWLNRERGTTDRRLVYLQPTAAGLEISERIWGEVVWVQQRYLQGFAEAERRQLLGFLERMALNAEGLDRQGVSGT